MQLQTGASLLHYRLVDKLGEGGMGVVWRAVDTTLDRQVAIKVLPDVFASDPDRAARFEREAKLLASLNHPNITTVHSVHQVEGLRFLVMELAHGEDLAVRLARGPLPLEDVLKIARQIAEALEAAHESGVVHRDLKPANVTVTDEGKVEVLDFGLAKALDPVGGSGDLSKSPTLVTSGHTAAGVILGTAAYMAPEQARGKTVDRRADIWAFGCVVYELLTRKKAFDGETVTDVLAAVVTRDPDWSAIPASTPRRLVDLLHRCLEKDPQRRLRDAGEARIVIGDLIANPSASAVGNVPAPSARRRPTLSRVLPWAAVAALAAVSIVAISKRGSAPPLEPTHLSVTLPPTDILDGGFENLMLAVSRDGRSIAYSARRDGVTRLYLRRLGDSEATELKGTEEAHSPFFSPDGRWVAFVSKTKLRKVPVDGGPVFDLCDVVQDRSGVWLDDGSIVLAPHAVGGLMRMASSGGALAPITSLDSTRAERTHRWPDALPGAEWVIFTIGTEKSPGDYEQAEIGAVSLRSGERRVLLQGASMARWCEPGYLVFSRNGSLFAARVDAKDPRVEGEPFPLMDRVDREPSSGAVHFAIARDGTLAFAPRMEGAELVSLVWVDHAGKVTKLDAPPREYLAPRITPDGKSVIVTIGPGFGAGDLWRYDIPRRTLTRLTFDGKSLVGYVTPDMREMVYTNEDENNHIAVQPLEGNAPPRVIHATGEPLSLSSLSPDGKWVFCSPWGTREADVLMIPLDGSGGMQTAIEEPLDQADGTLSRDGRWIAYSSRQAEGVDIFVRSFPPGTGRWQVSSGGAMMPRWSPTRDELYWVSGPSMFAADYEASGTSISFGTPRKLFDLPAGRQTDVDYAPYDIAPDGSAFLMTQIAHPEFARRRIDIVSNFPGRIRGLERKGVSP